MARGKKEPQTPGEAIETQPEPGAEGEVIEAPMPDGLPDQDEVDPSKISKAVLTRQGWVCPVKPAEK